MKQLSFFALYLFFVSPIIGQSNFEDSLQEQFILVEDGETIQLPAGSFEINSSLWLDGKKDVKIIGAGINSTTLSFKNQTEGAEGIKITNCSNILLSDFTVQDSKGDLIKTQSVDGISFVKIKTEWTGKPNKNNGSYGLYPVQCENVLIDGCVAIGASDAGIYVGQSNNIIVRNCKAIQNVAGIEIENSTNADVYKNEAYQNTGGILVFDLPGLIKKKGGNVRVFDNDIYDNNFKNFAPKGNIVAQVPPGTGIMILATSGVEIFDNKINNNCSFSLSIVSYYITESPFEDEEYDPYPYAINVYNNAFNRGKKKPSLSNKMGLLMRLKYKKNIPNIVYDGITDESHFNEDGTRKKEYSICIKDNENGSFGFLDAANDFKNLNRDSAPFDCEMEKLEGVKN